MNKPLVLIALTLAVCVSLLAGAAQAQAAGESTEGEEASDWPYHSAEQLRSMVTRTGRAITELTHAAGIGDVYIDADNTRYVVVEVLEDRIIVVDEGKEEMPDVTDALRAMEEEGARRPAAGLIQRLVGQVTGNRKVDIGIYHTHNDESYVPTSGTESKEYGDIHQVGKALKEALEAKGYKVEWRDDSHLPHDGQAYLRSRRTAADLSKSRPATIIDAHRDAIPTPDSYVTEVNGERMSQVRLVVGRQNQNREANLEYAKRIKAIADEKYPGLIMGIYHARGNYNQDLGPKMILLEFGTHLTGLDDAERSVELIADVIPAAAGLTPGAGDGNVGRAGRSTAVWLIVIAAVAGLGWVLLNKEGFEGIKRIFSGRGGEDGSDGQ